MFLLGIVRVPLTLFNTATPVAVELIGLAIFIYWKKIPLSPITPKPASGLFAEFSASQNHWAKKCVIAILLLWIVAKLSSIFLTTGLRPIYSWDAWAEWTTAAKVFYNSHSLMLDAPAQDFFGKSAVHRIIFYPLHNPLLQVWISLWNGIFDEVLVKFCNPIYLLSLVICFYYITIREINRILALSLLVIFLSAPLMSYHSTELNCDLMLGVYLFLASASFLKAIRGNGAYWVLTGIYSTEALFIKEQAFLFILPLILSAIVYLIFDIKRGSGKSHLLSLLIPFLGIVPWYIFVYHYGLEVEAAQEYGYSLMTSIFGEDPNRINKYLTFHPEILTGYFYWFATLNNFNVILFFSPLLLIAHGKLTKESLYLLFPIACYMLSYIFLYMFTIFFSWFLWGVIFFRNILTFYPTICLFIVLLLKKYTTIPVPERKI
jgi:4-amino-4-deoxy-L-arabinose transferase-like glycosyltransferase